ncbi:hypothetical protein SAMN04489712_14511 [Thermomonospora echinospora]|uniref:Phage integrase family protein n=1 Tax=Thermomonospora echinospora TaxID=1992 RepID=A0A1H6E9B6_9ACTN|nr:hypothetical protein [Thermomonospora echinospora]SEG94282.1 hypothetical protein SAMN04489712_14511 [Thermomonospora echinospora]
MTDAVTDPGLPASSPAFPSALSLSGVDAAAPASAARMGAQQEGREGYVLPTGLLPDGQSGPRFDDDIWVLRPLLRRTIIAPDLDFTPITDPVMRLAAKQYLQSRLRRGLPTSRRSGRGARPLQLTSAQAELTMFRHMLAELRSVGVERLVTTRQHHLDELLARWKRTLSSSAVACRVRLLQNLAVHGEFMTADRLEFLPWAGRPAAQVAGHRRGEENTTPRIPEEVMAPLLRAALFYVTTASVDLAAAQAELEGLRARVAARPPLVSGEGKQALVDFIAARRAAGRGLPALPAANGRLGRVRQVDGVLQAPNVSLITLLCGLRAPLWQGHRRLLHDAGAELGYEPGGLATVMSPWPDTGAPWRPSLDGWHLNEEVQQLRTACWIVIAYLSGMRDVEVRELAPDCAFTTVAADGRLRHKLRGKVFKGRGLTGDHTEWVVLEQVHQAVAVARTLHTDPTHLFGRRHGDSHRVLSDMPQRLENFCAHLEHLFGRPDQPYLPRDGDAPWRFTTPQFRRTLAWHIAHQPFGVVAGARQYKHTKIAVFEGYAGTSASGFAAEVAAEEAVARLDYVQDLYRDWNAGGRAGGGAAARIGAEFERIRAELGDLPGVVADEARLRVMLRHLTKTLHPGVLNDCFFNAATAVCVKRATALGRPVPAHTMCLRCPNARRSAVHLPRLIAARDQAQRLQDQAALSDSLPPLQQAALTTHVADLDAAIGQITSTPPEPSGGTDVDAGPPAPGGGGR